MEQTGNTVTVSTELREQSMETGKEMLYRRNLRAGEESEYRRLLSREACNLVE